LPDNKSDLARFLSEHVIVNAPPDKVVVAAEGFVDEREVQSSERAMDLSALKATHEEADTRLMVHCVNSSLDNVVVSARDTDVLLLLIAHVPHIPCPNLYMMSGTATKRKYFNIRGIYEKSLSWFCIRSSGFSGVNGLRHNVLHMQPVKEISLESIPKATHISFLSRRGRANRRKGERSRGICL